MNCRNAAMPVVPRRPQFSTSIKEEKGGEGLWYGTLKMSIPAQVGIALLNLGVLLGAPAVLTAPVWGAERIYVPYGPLQFSLTVSALETYAKEGKIEPELAGYARYIEPERLAQLRQVLTARVPVTPVAIAQFLYSRQGEIILERVSQLIQTQAGQPGFYAIRAALIRAATDPEGLTLLNVLREFPTYGIRINSQRGFQLFDDLSVLVQETELATAAVRRQAIAEAAAEVPTDDSQLATLFPEDTSQFLDLQQPGAVNFQKQTLILNDLQRNRSFPVDLYLPTSNSTQEKTPLVVISHGLGSERETFAYLAEHLASYGFAVAVPEHPGSNAAQLQALTQGLANEVSTPAELIDRPEDIKFLLDQLQRLYPRQLNLQNVGVLGQSFGGYTVLALAGANINFEQLQADCMNEENALNLSLLLQCRAQELGSVEEELQDERIGAAIAINPVISSIFGQEQLSQIQLPVMLVASSNDTVAPALPEQIRPFTWLTTPEKYLVLLEDGTHFSTLGPSTGSIPIPETALGPDPRIAYQYMNALSVAFFKTYIAGEPDYRRYLSSTYARTLSEDPLPLELIKSLTAEQLMEAARGGESVLPPALQP